MAEPLAHAGLPLPGGSGGAGADSLVTVLDRLLDTGVVAEGQLVVAVADVDLIYIGLRALLASVDTASRMVLLPGQEAAK